MPRAFLICCCSSECTERNAVFHQDKANASDPEAVKGRGSSGLARALQVRYRPHLGFVVLTIFSAGFLPWNLPAWLTKAVILAGEIQHWVPTELFVPGYCCPRCTVEFILDVCFYSGMHGQDKKFLSPAFTFSIGGLIAKGNVSSSLSGARGPPMLNCYEQSQNLFTYLTE